MFLKQAQKYIADNLNIDDNKMFEAKIILKSILNISEHNFILNDKQVTSEDLVKINEIIKKRNKRYPLQYLLGKWEFYGLDFYVGEGVLIPRADTEILCEETLNILKECDNKKIIDLCSGSGCIAIVIDKITNHKNKIYALEKSEKALKYLKKNKDLNNSNINILHDDVINPATKKCNFDIIVSNPPYLSVEDMTKLQEEVSFEPKMALYAEHNGYYFYENITDIWYDRLNKNGYLIYEVGINQSDTVSQIMSNKGFTNIRKVCDLNGIERVVIGQK